MLEGAPSTHYNLGNGAGYSILEVIDAAQRVTGSGIARESGPRRPGDPPVLVADATLAKGALHWRPRYPDLDTIILHAWRWEQKHFADAHVRPS